MKYDLLAIDLDGTLLDPQGRVSERNKAALRNAREAGLRVAVCTGRGLVECRHVLEQIAQVDPVVVAGGAIIADPVSGGTVHRFAIDQRLVASTVQRLIEHEHPALVLKDPVAAGYDYLVVRGRQRLPLDPVTEWWFGAMNVRVREVHELHEDDHPEHTVRVGACGLSGRMLQIKDDLAGVCGDRACIHSFSAVVAPDHASRAGGEVLHVLELFDIGANKWSAVSMVAKKLGLRADRIAAIGDEVNDVSMVRHAALGVAMGNAVESVRAVAQRHTLSNREDGVAVAVEKILDGQW
ncbi:MAG TPA: HAD-IIB family hydrolase [Phycisphaerales bacterium]|nr:HAD-IIB family hydrolase [Phycisphaerales bacterium]